MFKTLHFKSLFLLLCLIIGGSSSAWGDTWTYTFSNNVWSSNGNTTLNNVSWTLSMDGGKIDNYDSTKGLKFGTNSNTCSSVSISTSGISGTITSIAIEASRGSSLVGSLSVTVDGSSFTSTNDVALTTTNSTYTFSGSKSGTIDISWTKTSGKGAFYIKSVTITYTSAALSSIAVTTPPTTIDYKVGEAFSSDGMVVTGTYSDASTKAISGYTMAIGETALADGDVLNSAGSKTVTITYDGKTCTQDITVHALSSISLSGTYPTLFTEKDEFSHEGLVVTAKYDDNSTKDVTSEVTFSGYAMNTVGPQTVTVSYAPYEGATPVTTEYNITVNAGTRYTVTFDAQTGTCEPASLTENAYQGGVVLPSATCSKSGWVFAGWAEAAVTNTTTKPNLLVAGETYYPTKDITLHAVYKIDGIDDSKYKRATSLEDIISANSFVFVNSNKVLDHAYGSVDAPTESAGKITPINSYVWEKSGDNVTGFTITGTGTMGIGSLPTSSAIVSNTNSHNKWLFANTSYGENLFVLRNTELNSSDKVLAIEYTENRWKAYAVSSSTYMSTNSFVPSKIYIPIENAYNSNPSGSIIDPSVTFAKEGTTLYLDGTTTYTNAATVKGIDKTATYTSSDESVATVASDGTVTAVGIGTATITASVAQELGVNNAASATYEIVVKSTTTIAGIKNITDASDAVNFAADLTDAVVTYVKDGHAYIQDATAAIYASCGSDLTVGQKINGAVSGSVKAANKIDEITSIDLDKATVTNDGAIPEAEVKTLAGIKAAGTEYDGKLVTVNGATVTGSLSDSQSSNNCSIKDGSKEEDIDVSFNLYAPNKGITVNASEIGNFTGFVSIFNGSYRLNLYEQSQIVLTQNAARDQELSFEEDAIVLDEETTEFDNFIGQEVKGAQGTVTYAITGDAIGAVDNDGIVELYGTCGTATVTATAAAITKEVDGIPTPYKTATKSYTITVRPRYTVTFAINGIETEVREASFGAGVTAPTPAQIGKYSFVGWSTTEVATTDEEPTMVTVAKPSSNDEKYYAVFAKETISGTSGYYTLNYTDVSTSISGNFAYTEEKTFTASDGGTWILHVYCDKNQTGGLQINTGKGASIKVPTCPGNITTIEITCKSGATKAVGFSAEANGSPIATGTAGTSQTLDLNGENMNDGYIIPVGGNSVITNITVNYGASITRTGYTTNPTQIAFGGSPESNYTFATFSSEQAVVFTGDVEVFAVTVDDANNLVKSELTKDDYFVENEGIVENGYYVPANTGVMLRGTANSYNYHIAATTENVTIPTNMLIAGTDAVPAETDYKYYKLTYEDASHQHIGFYWGAVEGAPFMTKKGKAYLRLPKTVNARGFSLFDDDDTTTGIEMISSVMNDGEVYNLNGQRVDNLKKGGLYIVNGKKMVIK